MLTEEKFLDGDSARWNYRNMRLAAEPPTDVALWFGSDGKVRRVVFWRDFHEVEP